MGAPLYDGMVPWPDDVAQRYRQRKYWRGTPIGRAFDAAVVANRQQIALIEGDRRMTYGELAILVDRLGLHLAEYGIHSGAPVIIQLPNVIEFVIAYFACLEVGAIPVMCMPAHRHTEIGHIARHTEAAAWFLPTEHRGFDYIAMAEEVRETAPTLRELFVVGNRVGPRMTRVSHMLADPIEMRRSARAYDRLAPASEWAAVLQLSGGTTGLPKLIPRTHDDYLYNSLASAAATGMDKHSVLLVGLPIGHNFPLACPGIQGALLLGARVVLAPSPDPEISFDLIERERVTWVPAVPATVINWLDHPRVKRAKLSSLRTLAVGGSRLNPEPARRAFDTFGPALVQVYGMAEGLLCYTRHGDPQDVVTGTQGRPISPDDEIRVVDPAGLEVPAGEVGELQTRGPYTIRGYYKAEAHNRAAFTEDGFYCTGDLVRLHPSGNLVVEGRSKDLINRGGEKISAEEIENLIVTHPSVANAAVVAMPDPVLGERSCACVVLRPGESLTLETLTRHLNEQRIAKYKLPERLEVYERLPTTAVGKVNKAALREDVRRRLETS